VSPPQPCQPSTQTANVTLHISQFEGSSALSPFRVQQLVPALQAIHDKISGVAARFVHLVQTRSKRSLVPC